ncbi:MAG: amidase family protein [Oscillospiraceae bacterium]|jgi:aspartyl-tRNA(Asn)/glutamyl-tRNA(Gln) amidotransferase subunit A|nr:amidase family protein [Oscillospiraceae bacterium]
MRIAIDENIFIKGEICAAGSKMLENFKPPYFATVANRIKEAKMTIVCQSKTGEFGAKTQKKETAAHAVASGIADAALGMDVGGAAYHAAIESGVAYIKPTYGTVSRFGLAANVSSMDQIGVYAKNFDDGFHVLSAIAGHDENDGAMYPEKKYGYNADAIDPKSLRFADSPEFKLEKYLEAVYAIISAAEFCGNTARFDGLKFGHRSQNCKSLDDMITNSRSEGFSGETKIKILMGTYVLSEGQYEKYYHKAMQIRRLAKEELSAIFESFDLAIWPMSETWVALANLTGCPAIFAGGKIVMAKEFGESKLLAMGRSMIV